MSCNTCFEDWICKCVYGSIFINTRLTPGNVYYWRVTDNFSNKYSGSAVASESGTLEIDTTLLPDGMINQFAGGLMIQIFEELSCAPIRIPLTKMYDCISLDILGGTEDKSTIGCETHCAAGSGMTVMIPFTDTETLEIDWDDYAADFGNNPIIQVYHELEPNVFQLASVTIQQSRLNDVLDEVIIDNGGAATGYVLITA